MNGQLHTVYLGLGSNLGQRRQLLEQAIRLIDGRVGPVVRRSSLIETEPWGFLSDHPFLNGVVCCQTTLSPREVLQATQQIERELGKRPEHATQRGPSAPPSYHDRPVDIDILLYDKLVVDEPDLKIPHPLMYEREFVMKPLKQIINN